MYTILLREDNQLITSVRERVMQKSKLVDSLHILVDPIYKGIPMDDFLVTLEYITPVSREYKTETLVKSEELYKDKLEYRLDFDTDLTKEAGEVEISLTFTKVTLNPDGSNTCQVRKTSPTSITILPVTAWSSIIPDSALSALDQRIIMTQAMLEAANEMANYIDSTKADNISYDSNANIIQLTANGIPIGNAITLNSCDSNISSIKIDEDGNLIIVHKDGTEENLGKLSSGECAGIYIPSLDGDIMTFTLSDKATEETISFDIDQDNNWNPIDGSESGSNYIWQEL